MLVSIVIPTLNEKKTLFDVLSKCLALPLDKEIIVVDNNSTDWTYSSVVNYVTKERINDILILLEPRRGKGLALRTGFEHARGDIIIFQDADLEYDPAHITALADALRDHDVVFGCRTGKLYHIGIPEFIANKLILGMINRRFKVRLSDVFTGQRGFRRRALEDMGIASEGFDVETELTIKTLKMGYSWCEVQVPYSPRSRKDGKKIGFSAFMRILYRYLLSANFSAEPSGLCREPQKVPSERSCP